MIDFDKIFTFGFLFVIYYVMTYFVIITISLTIAIIISPLQNFISYFLYELSPWIVSPLVAIYTLIQMQK